MRTIIFFVIPAAYDYVWCLDVERVSLYRAYCVLTWREQYGFHLLASMLLLFICNSCFVQYAYSLRQNRFFFCNIFSYYYSEACFGTVKKLHYVTLQVDKII